ncbi:MAG: type II toxin-antitoxin system VapC family toxin [Alphaproteobacteria bacterium]
MSFLLDTNVVSEEIKPRPDPGVSQWLREADEDRVFVSAVTLAELRFGTARLPDSRRRRMIEDWLTHQVMQRFAGRLLAVDTAVADTWGEVVAASYATGRPISILDGFLAATAAVHDLTLVTRNISDFVATGVSLLNPWTDVS